MNMVRKITAVLLCVIMIGTSLPAFVSRAGAVSGAGTDEALPSAPVFRLESVTVDNEERLRLRIHVTDIPETGLASALIAVQFDRELKYVSCEFNSSLRGQKVAGTVDIDRGAYLERRFVWLNGLNSAEYAMYEDFVYVTCEFALPEGLDEDRVYPIGLQVSSDPTYYLDSKGDALGASAVGGEVIVRDFDRELHLSAIDSEVFGAGTACVPVMFSGTESVRGGLASANFTLSWDDRLELVSLAPQQPLSGAQITLNGESSADISWTCGDEGPMTEGKLSFFAVFKIPLDAKAGDVYEVCVDIPDGDGAFVSGRKVGLDSRIVEDSALLSVRGVNTDNRQRGDVNGDGKINVRDILLIMRMMLGFTAENYPPLAACDLEMADFNGDGNVNAKDVIGIMRKMLSDSAPSLGPVLDTKVSIDGYPEAYNEFLSSTVFVGDSICKGLSVYEYLPADNVVAEKNAGAWSISKYDFDVRGKKYGVTEALDLLGPKNVVLFIGVNDTWERTDYFIEKYTTLIEMVRDTLPDAKLYVSSITPVSKDCADKNKNEYLTNERIDEFNRELKSLAYNMGCGFVNVSDALKGEDNAVASQYGASDGLHMQPAAYPVILGQICSQIVG